MMNLQRWTPSLIEQLRQILLYDNQINTEQFFDIFASLNWQSRVDHSEYAARDDVHADRDCLFAHPLGGTAGRGQIAQVFDRETGRAQLCDQFMAFLDAAAQLYTGEYVRFFHVRVAIVEFGDAAQPHGLAKVQETARAFRNGYAQQCLGLFADRGALGDTVVETGSKLDSLVQIGHGAHIGTGSLLAAYTAVGGSARMGRLNMFGGRSGLNDHATTGDGIWEAGNASNVNKSPAGARHYGVPAIEAGLWRRAVAAFARLPELLHRQRRLEKRLDRLEARLEAETEDESE